MIDTAMLCLSCLKVKRKDVNENQCSLEIHSKLLFDLTNQVILNCTFSVAACVFFLKKKEMFQVSAVDIHSL